MGRQRADILHRDLSKERERERGREEKSKSRDLISWSLKTHREIIIIIIIITYIYNALNDALSASRIHNKLKTILSKYIHIQNRQS